VENLNISKCLSESFNANFSFESQNQIFNNYKSPIILGNNMHINIGKLKPISNISSSRSVNVKNKISSEYNNLFTRATQDLQPLFEQIISLTSSLSS